MAFQQDESNEAELKVLFISFARVTLDHMEVWATSGGIPNSFHRHVDFTKEGTRSRFEMKRDYTKLFLLHWYDPVWKTKVVEDCIRRHRAAWNLFPPLEEEEGLPFNTLLATVDGTVLQFFWLFIVNALESYKTFQLTEEQLSESYQSIREMRKVKNWCWSVTIPLLGFTSDIGRIEPISTYLQLAPFTAEEKAALWNRETVELEIQPLLRLPSVRDIDVKAFSSTRFKLAGTFVAEGKELYNQQQVFDDVENVLTALRLVKEGDVGVLAFLSQLDEPGALKGPPLMKLPNERLREKKSTYWLSEADLATAKVLSSSLHQLDKQKSDLTLALR